MAGFAYFGNMDSRNRKEQYPLVEYTCSSPTSQWNGVVYECELIFVFEGGMYITNESEEKTFITTEKGILLVPGHTYEAHFEENTSMIRFRLDGNFPLREYFRTDKAELLGIQYSEDIKSIKVNDKLRLFLTSLYEECQQGAVDTLLTEIKRKELFHILNNHYDRQEILTFLFPLLSDNYSFISFVYNNYRKVNNVREFAALARCSQSTFCGKFKYAFGVSAYQWMMGRRNYIIIHELTGSTKQIKLIAAEVGFSLPQFCDYCKKHFGMTANEIRKYGVKEIQGAFGMYSMEL